jgi:polyphosphate glucokinase
MLSGGTLSIDIGGTGLKAAVLDPQGKPINERVRIPTPRPATPPNVLAALAQLIEAQPKFERISVGFPGVVFDGVVSTAPNMDDGWGGFDLRAELNRLTGKPVRVANDADIQGLGVIEGKGVEMLITFGTGIGCGLYVDGHLVPNLELGHHPFRNGKTYEEQLGLRAFERIGKSRWNKRVRRMIAQLEPIFNYRVLYLGGGNSRKIKGDLPPNVRVTDNVAGILGGIKLWRDVNG